MIKLVNPTEIDYLRYQSTVDDAHCKGIKLTPRAYHYEDTETGQQYHDLYGCIGWPTEDEDNKKGLPGYLAIIGVVKSDKRPPEKAGFRLMGEYENPYLIALFMGIQVLRNQFGFGQHPELLKTFYGDPDKNITDLAAYNADLERTGEIKKEIILAPPLDMYDTEAFDNYKRSLDTAILNQPTRFVFGGNSILKTKHHEYRRNNPAVYAIGGLIHTLLHTTPWMDSQSENMFVVEEGV